MRSLTAGREDGKRRGAQLAAPMGNTYGALIGKRADVSLQLAAQARYVNVVEVIGGVMPEVLTPPGDSVTSVQEVEEQPVRKSADVRKEALARLIANQIASGARVESQSDYQAVLVRGHRLNNTLHLILTIVTFGLWGFVWLALALFGGEKREMASVDEWGNTSIQRL